MTLAATRTQARGMRVIPPAPLPLAALVAGRPAGEVAALLPRLFNLCRGAQSLAADLALGLPPRVSMAELRAEILREHLCRLCLILPRLLGLSPRAMPAPEGAGALLGPAGRMPETVETLMDWAEGPAPLAPVVAALIAALAPGQATGPDLPMVTPATALTLTAQENSAAGRCADHPLLRALSAQGGRGPLWRLTGMLVDLERTIAGDLPRATIHHGTALVPAARGLYALRVELDTEGRVTRLDRATPTDHLLAPGGALQSALDALPPTRHALAPLIVALHDPCVPVTLQEVQDA